MVLVGLLGACGGSAGSAPAGQSANSNPNGPEVNAAGDIPDNQVYVPYSDPGGLFTVSVPQGWSRSASGSGVVFTDKLNSVRIEAQPRPTAPDVASARAQEVPRLQGSVTGFKLGDVSTAQRSAGAAVLVTYQAVSASNAVTGRSAVEAVERYEFWKGGQEVILTLSGAQGADNVDPWKKITDSFRWNR
ncbi:hypothetical protein [Pseudonocardia acidicola]|uniref:Lipoprotein LpqN n=1 Tax=Pseudonocardia acidicola TaxID=2724939 RepID=A0ABX1SMA9_9PSEU|nr:hypothetical protein [Pseudonocardia acidicola]NMI01659.1 hypothetical protein [Pseudonocardia acidicola]